MNVAVKGSDLLFINFNQDFRCVRSLPKTRSHAAHSRQCTNAPSLQDRVISKAFLHQLIPQYFLPSLKTHSCISVGTKHGFKIYNCDPFGKYYSKSTWQKNASSERRHRIGHGLISPVHTQLLTIQVIAQLGLSRCSFAPPWSPSSVQEISRHHHRGGCRSSTQQYDLIMDWQHARNRIKGLTSFSALCLQYSANPPSVNSHFRHQSCP